MKSRISHWIKNTKLLKPKVTDPVSFFRGAHFYLLLNENTLLPGPTCKKMMDLSPAKVFKSSVFEPSDEELTKHARSKRERARKSWLKRDSSEDEDDEDDVRMGSLEPKKNPSSSDLGDLSDDDLPDVANIFDERPAKRQKKEAASEDVSNYILPFSPVLTFIAG